MSDIDFFQGILNSPPVQPDRQDSIMKNRSPFTRDVVLRANAHLIEHRGRPAKLPRELLGIVTFRPRTIEEINSAFASAYAKLRETEFA